MDFSPLRPNIQSSHQAPSAKHSPSALQEGAKPLNDQMNKTGGMKDAALMEKAKAFEASFIAQALKFSGFDKALTMGGGQDMDAFTTFVLESVASDIVEQGGFGIAQDIYDQSKTKIKNDQGQ